VTFASVRVSPIALLPIDTVLSAATAEPCPSAIELLLR
jgi:hypothetical protein